MGQFQFIYISAYKLYLSNRYEIKTNVIIDIILKAVFLFNKATIGLDHCFNAMPEARTCRNYMFFVQIHHGGGHSLPQRVQTVVRNPVTNPFNFAPNEIVERVEIR